MNLYIERDRKIHIYIYIYIYINRNYTKEVAKQGTILQTWHQAINRILEIENKATKPTDILEDKRNDKDKHRLKTLSSSMKSCDIT